ncbi:S1 family peptidase [Gaetbulibacter saemankumensis]|uniref:S1 family peptidase n=1 Tax=Gaetbulibacter saemankumensis TaxID=311208 RepID=UPI0004100056|nr:serine protease [Gaetbulibacter saemankumensis]
MKYTASILGLALLTIVSCKQQTNSNENTVSNNAEPIKEATVIHDSKFVADYTNSVQKLFSSNNYVPFDELQMQLMDRVEENSEVTVTAQPREFKNGNEMYYYLKDRTVAMGSSYLCDRCPNIHLNNASGFVIHEDGIIVTNFHVVETRENGPNISAVFASDADGNVYPVVKILSASQSNDLAILKVDTKGKKLKALALAEQELMGEDVYLMGHPFDNYFFMTKGMVARNYISDRTGEVKMAITAEFGQGASGGPVVNNYGEVVGVVSATAIHYTNGSKVHGDPQLIVKETVPVSVLHTYLKQ